MGGSTLGSRLALLERKRTPPRTVLQRWAADRPRLHAAWLAGLTDAEREYQTLRRLESAARTGICLHQVRCGHHLADLLTEAPTEQRAPIIEALWWVSDLLTRRAEARGGPRVTDAGLLAYLAGLNDREDYRPRNLLTSQDLRSMYPRGVRPERLAEAEDAGRYPKGRPLPPCLVCQRDEVPLRSDVPLHVAVCGLNERQVATLAVLAFTVVARLVAGETAPSVGEQIAWVRGEQTVPAAYREALAWAAEVAD